MKKIYLILFLFALGIGSAFAQKQVVKGVVNDINGLPIPGVNVFEQSAPTNGVITGGDGSYTIAVDSQKDVLVFSFIGFDTQEVVVGKKTTINITLEEETTGLDEVVVVGYGTQSKKNISGSVGKIELSAIGESGAGESVESLLQGRLAGVNIQMNTGEPGATPVVLVRGLGTLSREDKNATSPPLFVIDGVPYITGDGSSTSSNALADIDPNDIADITVLKDASSASIYGSRAINGVILVTTKRGKSGRPEIRFNGKFGANIPGQMRNTAGGALERQLKVDLYRKYNPSLELPLYLSDSLNGYWNNSTDWQKERYQVSNYQNYNFSIRGAGDFGNYSLSLGHLNNVGTVKNTGYKRSNLRLNNTLLTLKDKLSINAVVNITHTDRSRRVSAIEPSVGTSLAPNTNSALYDGLDELGKTVSNDIGDRFLGNLNLTLYPFKGIILKSALSANFGRGTENIHYPWTIVKEDGDLKYSNYAYEGESTHYIMENTLTYSSNLKKIHNLTFLLGTSMEYYEGESQSIHNDRREAFNEIINWPVSVVDGGSGYGAYSMGSYFTRLNYTLLDRYLFSGSVRADGSSKFGEDNKWGTFPAASFGWIISNEKIFENLHFLSMAKLRLSWGESGGQFSKNYLAQGILQATSNYGGGAGFTPLWDNGYRNKQLTWEKSAMWDIGFDINLFNGRVDIQTDYYKKETQGLLMTLDLANTSGYERVYSNAADVVNEGFEFTLNTTNIDRSSFKWESNFNFATNKNYVSGIVGGDEDIIRDGSILRVGLPSNGFFFYKSVGIIQGADEVPVNPENGKRLTGIDGEYLDVGDKLYEDVNGDYLIDEKDRQYVGDPVPDLIGGFNNNVYWKNWYAYISTTFLIGRDVINSAVLDQLDFDGDVDGSIPDLNKYNIWKKPGDAAKYPSINPWNERPQVMSDDTDYIEDGSYFKINSITLGYNFQRNQIRKLKLRQLKAYTTFSNIATFQSYSGPDAEMVSPSGYDGSGGYPAPFTVIVGLTVGF